MSADDFLAWDAHEPVRHEFVRGEVFAMAGAEERHVTVALSIAMALRTHLRGTPCRTFITDMTLRVVTANAFYYPDVMVTRSTADATQPLIKSEPVLVVEVLSPSTAADDRSDAGQGVHLASVDLTIDAEALWSDMPSDMPSDTPADMPVAAPAISA